MIGRPHAPIGQPAVTTEHRASVLLIKLNRPHVRNAINGEMARGIAAALDELDASNELRAGVITGNGGTFSAGMDFKAFLAGEVFEAGDRGFAGITMRPSIKPLIAAVEGFAVAGGMEVALCCDLIVAAAGAEFGLPEVTHGLAASSGGAIRLARRIPRTVAMELALTGHRISAQRAFDVGLVNRVTPPAHALQEALSLALNIAENSSAAVIATKHLIDLATDAVSEELMSEQARISADLDRASESTSGAQRFLTRRQTKP